MVPHAIYGRGLVNLHRINKQMLVLSLTSSTDVNLKYVRLLFKNQSAGNIHTSLFSKY